MGWADGTGIWLRRWKWEEGRVHDRSQRMKVLQRECTGERMDLLPNVYKMFTKYILILKSKHRIFYLSQSERGRAYFEIIKLT